MLASGAVRGSVRSAEAPMRPRTSTSTKMLLVLVLVFQRACHTQPRGSLSFKSAKSAMRTCACSLKFEFSNAQQRNCNLQLPQKLSKNVAFTTHLSRVSGQLQPLLLPLDCEI